MFELSLSTTIDKQSYFLELYKMLAHEIKQDGGVIAKENCNGRTYLAIAVCKSKKEYYKAKILDYILFMIVDDYKFNYYKEHLKSGIDENIVFQAFLKAISIFDAEIDKDVIKSQISLSGELLIDSFFYFKLQSLQNRWEKTVGIIIQNQILKSSSAIVEVLKYLIAMSDSGVSNAAVSITQKQLALRFGGVTKKYKSTFKGASDLLTEIVRRNPMKINITHQLLDDVQEKFVGALQNIFTEKINIVN